MNLWGTSMISNWEFQCSRLDSCREKRMVGSFSRICNHKVWERTHGHLSIWTSQSCATNPAQLFMILELSSPTTSTFFTPDGNIGLALYHIWKIFGLLIRDIPYEEYFLGSEELEILSSRGSSLYHNLWDPTCHFCIWINLSDTKGGVI